MTGTLAALAPAPSPDPAARSADPEPLGPVPLRWWWLKRLTLLALLLAAALAGLRLWWGWEAERRLRRLVDPLRSHGAPLRIEDLAPPPVGDGAPPYRAAVRTWPPALHSGTKNAAAYLNAADAAIDPRNPSPANSQIVYPNYPPFGAAWEALASKSVAANGKTFALARQARRYDRYDWGVEYQGPAVAVLLRHLNGARQLANTLGDAALYAHLHGDDAAALEAIRDVRHVARGLEGEHFLVSHLVCIGMEQIIQQRLQVISAGLRVGAEGDAPDPATLLPTAPPADRPAPRAQVRALIGELLDDGPFAASLKDAFAGERVAQLDVAEQMARTAELLRPMFALDAERVLEQDGFLVEAASKPNLPAAKARLAEAAARKPPPAASGAPMFGPTPPPGTKRQPIDYTRIVSSATLPTGALRAVQNHMISRTDRRMSAVSLAVQLYRADHGQWPPTPDALVPKYLPAVPVDPMAADGRPLGYRIIKGGLPDGGDRPLVFSVGTDGVDDSAKGGIPAGPTYGWYRGRDEWRDLTRWTPPPSATQPVVR
jgi:hypothetical protein